MKKFIYISTILSTALLASCQNEKYDVIPADSTVRYTVQLPEEMRTKIIGDDAPAQMQLVYEVWRTDVDEDIQFTEADRLLYHKDDAEIINGTASFEIQVVKDQSTTVLFWAQVKDNGVYNVEKLTEVQFVGSAANNDDAVVFSGVDFIKKGESLAGRSVNLTRPVAQLNIATTPESLKEFKEDIEIKKSSLSVKGLYSAFNVAEQTPVGQPSVNAFTYTEADAPAGSLPVNSKNYTYAGMNYLGFIPANGTNVDLSFTIVTSDGNISHEVKNVPVKPNYRTNIIGNLITASSDYDVSLEAGWSGVEEELILIYVSDLAELQTAIDNAQVGVKTYIQFTKDIEGIATIVEKPDVDILIDGADNKFDGTFRIHSASDRNNGSVTFTNIVFETSTSSNEFIQALEFSNTERLSQNITVKDCSFYAVAGSQAEKTAVAIKVNSSQNLNIVNCTAIKLHSLLQAQSCDRNIVLDKVTITDCKNGVSFGNTALPTIKNSIINTTAYGVRGDGDGRDCVLNIEETTITAAKPIIIRRVSDASYTYIVNLNGGLLDTAEYFSVIFTNNEDNEDLVRPNGKWDVSGADNYNVFPRDYYGDPVIEGGAVVDGVFVEHNTYSITNAAGFKWIATKPQFFFSGKTIKLEKDIDFNYDNLTPINFGVNSEISGVTVDGQNHTLSKIMSYQFIPEYQNYNDNQALFNGKVDIKNLNVDLAGVYGRGYAGVIGGTIYGSLDNCHVTNSGVEGYFWQAGGLVGQYCGGSITNCSVTSTHVNSYSAVGALVGLIGDTTNGVTCLFDNCTVNGCEVRASGSLGEYYDNSFGVVAGWVTEGKTVYISECDFQNNIYVTDRTANTTAELPICGKYAEGSVIIE